MISVFSECSRSNISEILEGKLYLGDQYAPSRHKALTRLGVTHILNVTRNIEYREKRDITYSRIGIDDGDEGIDKHFDEAIRFIKEGDVVLVHCKEGKSRSASIVIAYLMKVNHWGFYQALDFVKGKRDVVCPHFNFQVKLLQREELSSRLPTTPIKRKLPGNDSDECEQAQAVPSKKRERNKSSEPVEGQILHPIN